MCAEAELLDVAVFRAENAAENQNGPDAVRRANRQSGPALRHPEISGQPAKRAEPRRRDCRPAPVQEVQADNREWISCRRTVKKHVAVVWVLSNTDNSEP